MPQHQIQTIEYECDRRSYKQITRRNEVEKNTMPNFSQDVKTGCGMDTPRKSNITKLYDFLSPRKRSR